MIPFLRWLAPFYRKDRLLGLVPGRRMENITDPYGATENGSTYTTQEGIKKRWAAILHQSIDGSSLKNSQQVTGQYQWVADGTSLLFGRNYINCHKVRIGALPTRSRTTRGRRSNRLCRAACMAQKTNNHVLQICPSAHKARIDRHDAVLSYLGRNLQEGNPPPVGPRRATLPDAGRAEEARYCGNNGHTWAGDRCPNCRRAVGDLERDRTAKIRKYADNPDIERAIQRETGATNIRHLPVILSWRAVWFKASALDFLTLGTITRRDLAVIATRVLIGGIIAHRDFNRSTAVMFGR